MFVLKAILFFLLGALLERLWSSRRTRPRGRQEKMGFLRLLISNSAEVSSKRLILLSISFTFSIFCVVLPIVLYGFVIHERNLQIIDRSFDILDKLVDYMAWTMWVYVGAITTSDFAPILLARVQVAMQRVRRGIAENVITQNVKEQNVSGTAVVNSEKLPAADKEKVDDPPPGEGGGEQLDDDEAVARAIEESDKGTGK